MKRTSGGLSGDGGAARGAQKGETMAQKTFARPLMFTRQALWRLILPLVLEQLLLVTVGMADTVMVSTVGEAAVSGISLVDQVNVLLIQIFAALATGRRRGGKPVSGPAGQGKCLPLRQAAGIRHLRHGGCHRRAGAGAQPAHPSTGVRQCGAGRNAGRRDIFLAFGAVIPDAGAVSTRGRRCSAAWATAAFRCSHLLS